MLGEDEVSTFQKDASLSSCFQEGLLFDYRVSLGKNQKMVLLRIPAFIFAIIFVTMFGYAGELPGVVGESCGKQLLYTFHSKSAAFRLQVEELINEKANANYQRRTFAEYRDGTLREVLRRDPDRHGLDDEQLVSIYMYSSTTAYSLNAALRKGGAESVKWEPFRSMLESALRRLPCYVGVSYRKTKLPSEVLADYKVGAVISDPGFLSSSAHYRGAARDTAMICYEFRSKTGRHISAFQANPNEDEVVFLPRTRFKIISEGKDPIGARSFVLEEVD